MPCKYDLMLEDRFDDPVTVNQHVEAGEYLLPYAKRWGLSIGFEVFDTRIAYGIDSENWGCLFDIGHIAYRGVVREGFADFTEQAVAMIKERMGGILGFHVHGATTLDGKPVVHEPLDDANVIDYRPIIELLQSSDFKGPLIFEIVRRKNKTLSLQEMLEVCAAAKKQLLSFAS